VDRILKDWKAIAVFVVPAFLFYSLVFLIPIIWSVVYSLYDGSPISGFVFSGAGNYLKLLTDRRSNSAFGSASNTR